MLCYLDMIRTGAVPLILKRSVCSLALRSQPSTLRLAFSSLATQIQHDVKSFDELPGPGQLESLVDFVRKGGIKNYYEIQSKKFDKFGPIFKEEIFGIKAVHVADAEAHEIIAQSEAPFPLRGLMELDGVMEIPMWALVGNDYKRWKAARSPIAPTFLRPVEIQKFASGVNTVAIDAVKRLRRELRDGRIDRLKEELDGYAAENICLLIFGQRMGFYDDPPNPSMIEFIHNTLDFSAAVADLWMKPTLWKYMPVYKKLTKAKEKIFSLAAEFAEMRKARKQESEDLCLFDKIGDKEDENFVNGLAIALCQVGVETTSSTLLWCLYHLSQNPEVQDKAYREVISAIGPTNTDNSLEISQFYSQLPFVKACVKESLRFIQLAVFHTRTIDKDTIICGYNIPAKSTVCLWPWYLSFSPKYFCEPEEFKPERWIRSEHQEKINPYAYIPFGFGVRMCLGRRFAEMELAYGLAHIIRSFRLEYVGNEAIRPILKDGFNVPEKEPAIRFNERV